MGIISIEKDLAVAEDIAFGMDTVEQERSGTTYTLEQVNASHIPYNSAQSLTEKIDAMVSGSDSSYVSALNSEAARRTSASYAVQPQNELVQLCTSNGDGSYSYADIPNTYSSLHYEATAQTDLDVQNWEATASKNTAESYALEDTDVVVWTSNGDGTYTQTIQTGIDSSKTSADKASVDADKLEDVIGALRTDNVFVATAGQTDFSVDYNIGMVDVYVEGIKLISGTDFTATNGNSVVLTSGVNSGDDVNIVAWGLAVFAGFSTTEW